MPVEAGGVFPNNAGDPLAALSRARKVWDAGLAAARACSAAHMAEVARRFPAQAAGLGNVLDSYWHDWATALDAQQEGFPGPYRNSKGRSTERAACDEAIAERRAAVACKPLRNWDRSADIAQRWLRHPTLACAAITPTPGLSRIDQKETSDDRWMDVDRSLF